MDRVELVKALDEALKENEALSTPFVKFVLTLDEQNKILLKILIPKDYNFNHITRQYAIQSVAALCFFLGERAAEIALNALKALPDKDLVENAAIQWKALEDLSKALKNPEEQNTMEDMEEQEVDLEAPIIRPLSVLSENGLDGDDE